MSLCFTITLLHSRAASSTYKTSVPPDLSTTTTPGPLIPPVIFSSNVRSPRSKLLNWIIVTNTSIRMTTFVMVTPTHPYPNSFGTRHSQQRLERIRIVIRFGRRRGATGVALLLVLMQLPRALMLLSLLLLRLLMGMVLMQLLGMLLLRLRVLVGRILQMV